MFVRILLSIISTILVTATARAFDTYPEFHMLSEGETTALDQTTIIDSEYQSDVVSYMRPSNWDPEFHASPAAFDLTLGSFNNTHFLHHDRLKIRKALTETLEFRLTYFKQRDFDVDQWQTILELVQRLTPLISFSAYGQPSHFKRENDFGLALLIHPSKTHEFRLYNTWIDFTRPEHNDRTDRFINGGEPIAIGFTDRWYSADNAGSPKEPRRFFETFARWEPNVRWDFQFNRYDYRYRMFTAGTASRLAIERWPGTVLNLRLQFSRKFESFEPYSATATKSLSSLERNLAEALVSIELPRLPLWGRATTIEPGLGWFHRSYHDHLGQTLDHRNLMPNVWITFEGFEREADQRDLIALGYEMTFFASEGENSSLAANELKAWSVEHRANLRYTFALKDRAQLSLVATGDVDSAVRGSGGLFEGGNGQFRVFF